jgi:hypothetical protein
VKSLRLISLFAVGSAFLYASTSQAATAVIKVLPAKPLIVATLAAGADDEISAAVTTSGSLIIAGTVTGTSGDWVTTPSLGGSDGFIASISFSGVRNWDLRLGGATDEIASALVRDKSGNYWVVGSAAKSIITTDSPTPAPSSSPTAILNPDGVVVDPLPAASPTLDQLVVWKVSRTGALLATYSIAAPGTIFPQSLALKGSLFTASGEVASGGITKKFTILFDSDGNFSQLILAKLDPLNSTSVVSLTAGPNHWWLSTSAGPIAGIPSWKPKRALPVAILYSKTGKILDARYFTTTPRISVWQAGIGLVSLSEQGSGFGMTIVNPLAG